MGSWIWRHGMGTCYCWYKIFREKVDRIWYSSDVFIQVYLNSKKEKLNLALVISKNRIYGVDKEGGIYHEHPLDNPETHIPLQKGISLEEFILKSIDILKNLGIL